ncbi:hypothetical protein E8E11_001947 [Didymella keratinophila]|nr:hypothetical protein E8E11_001947 [Didymella keratinophila]
MVELLLRSKARVNDLMEHKGMDDVTTYPGSGGEHCTATRSSPIKHRSCKPASSEHCAANWRPELAGFFCYRAALFPSAPLAQPAPKRPKGRSGKPRASGRDGELDASLALTTETLAPSAESSLRNGEMPAGKQSAGFGRAIDGWVQPKRKLPASRVSTRSAGSKLLPLSSLSACSNLDLPSPSRSSTSLPSVASAPSTRTLRKRSAETTLEKPDSSKRTPTREL